MSDLDDLRVAVWELTAGEWAWVADIGTWEKVEATPRFNAVGPMTLDLPVNTQTTAVAKDRALTIDFRGKRLTYLVADFGAKSDENGRPVISVVGVDALVLLFDMLAYPAPDEPIRANKVAQSRARYRAEGDLESILGELIAANAERRGDALVVPTSEGRGGDGKLSERFSNVGEIVTEKASVAGLGVRVGLVETTSSTRAAMTVEFYEPEDKSGWVELAHRAGTLRTWEQHDAVPTVTRAIVGGDGKGKERVFLRWTSDDSTEAEETWGRQREVFIDARGATLDEDGIPEEELGEGGAVTLALRQKGAEALTGGIAQSAFSLETVEAAGMRWVDHYDIGDTVLVQLLTGVERAERLGAVSLVADMSGVVVKPIPGNPDSTDPLFKQARIMRGLAEQVRTLQREEA